MCDENLKQLIQESLQNFKNDPKLTVTEIKLGEGSKNGDNYMSVVSCLDVIGHKGNGAAFFCSLFLKKPPNNSDRCKLFSIDKAFKNEKIMYENYFPKVTEFDIPVAKCIHADDNIIIFENLKTAGYRMSNRRESLDPDDCRLCIQALAKFHSSSYYLKTMNNDEFDDFNSKINDFALIGSFYSRMIDGALDDCLKVLRKHEDDSVIARVIPKIERLVGIGLETMVSLTPSDKLSVLCHGDFWMNNLLFRYDEENVLTDVKILDFQAPRFQSFATDLWTFIYTSMKHPLLENRLEELVTLYCNTFVSSITSKVPESKIPRYDDVFNEFRRKQLYGFFVAMWYLPALYIDSTTVSDFEELMSQDVTQSDFADSIVLPKEYDDRVLAVVRHCDSYGVFDIP